MPEFQVPITAIAASLSLFPLFYYGFMKLGEVQAFSFFYWPMMARCIQAPMPVA
jgi:hypothetical protein